MTTKFNNLNFRPITGPEEIQLFCQLPYVLNFELEDDLVAGSAGECADMVALRSRSLQRQIRPVGEKV